MLDNLLVDQIINNALKEDLGWGDVTTDSTITDDRTITGHFIAKQAGVLSGITVCKRVFELLDTTIQFTIHMQDGQKTQKGDIIAVIEGPAQNILKGERVALNLLQRMSGIATATSLYVEKVQGLKTKIVDTRKTAPGLRILDKYSVRMGGGSNHRFNLSDMVLIKDNHIKAAGGITPAVRAAKARQSHTIKIEVEAESIEMLQEAIAAGADIVMLDNMTTAEMAEAVKAAAGRVLLEASGNVALEGARGVREIALTGVDMISIGALTHSVEAMDISLRFQ